MIEQAHPSPSLAERLHVLLTLFLITQTRLNNIPLFAIFGIQSQFLGYLSSPQTTSSLESPASTGGSSTYSSASIITVTTLILSYASYFFFGGSNAISSIDLSNAYNGISGYDVTLVGLLLFLSNWAGPVWWSCKGAIMLGQLAQSTPLKQGWAIYGVDRVIAAANEPRTSEPKVEENASMGQVKGREWVQRERAFLREQTASSPPKPDPSVQQSASKLTAQATVTPTQKNEEVWQAHFSLLTLFIAATTMAVMVACTALRTHLFIWTVFSPKYLYAAAWGVGWHWGLSGLLGGLFYALS